MNIELTKQLHSIVGDRLFLNEPMNKHTTFKVGGPADYFALPSDIKEIKALLLAFKKAAVPVIIIGKGSNLIVKDNGFRGGIIKLGDALSSVTLLDNSCIKAYAGISMAALSAFAYRHSLSGLEFAEGIPGTLGGGICMNAGAYDGELKDVIHTVTLLNENYEQISYSNKEMLFGYRSSVIQKKPSIVLYATLQLEKGDSQAIQQKMTANQNNRKNKQPIELPSAGSTFKRPKGYFAGKLIIDAGLQGHQIGGAQVSQKHAGFIVNNGNATAADIIALIGHVQSTVYKQFGVSLETEVKIIGA